MQAKKICQPRDCRRMGGKTKESGQGGRSARRGTAGSINDMGRCRARTPPPPHPTDRRSHTTRIQSHLLPEGGNFLQHEQQAADGRRKRDGHAHRRPRRHEIPLVLWVLSPAGTEKIMQAQASEGSERQPLHLPRQRCGRNRGGALARSPPAAKGEPVRCRSRRPSSAAPPSQPAWHTSDGAAPIYSFDSGAAARMQ